MFYFERREYKYHIGYEKLSALRKSFLPFMRHDAFCAERSDQQYTVRSIYFDTHNLQFYNEKKMGIKIRKKLHIRVYDFPAKCHQAFLEIKNKREDTIFKERASIPGEHLAYFAHNPHLLLKDNNGSANGGKAIEKFIYFLYRLSLEPLVLVVYEREALTGLDDPSLRVTFDLNVRSYANPLVEEIFREEDLIEIDDKEFILEIKTYGKLPLWVRNIVRDYNLRLEAISKYCDGVDAGRRHYKRLSSVQAVNGFRESARMESGKPKGETAAISV